MSALRHAFLVAAIIIAPRELGAQDPPRTPREFHDRLVAFIARLAPRPLPAGDTSVTWTRSPILYHTVSRSDTLISSGFLRNDGLMGLATVTWDRTVPRRFQVTWVRGDSVLVELSGAVQGADLVVTGTKSGTFRLPAIPWTVCDYGMDEHMVPVLQHLTSGSMQSIAVFRPFGFKWDTVKVRVAHGPEGTLRIAEPERADTTRLVITDAGDLLQLTRDTTIVERRPLEETRLYALYRRLRITPPDMR